MSYCLILLVIACQVNFHNSNFWVSWGILELKYNSFLLCGVKSNHISVVDETTAG